MADNQQWDDHAAQEIERAIFDQSGNSWRAWYRQAGDLLRVARHLARERNRILRSCQSDPEDPDFETGAEYLRSALLLRAFGMEGLFKALWLARGGLLTNAGRYAGIPSIKDTHDLCALAGKLSIELTTAERDVLERLTVFGEFGRYPIARHYLKGGMAKQWWSVADNSTLAIIRGRVKKAVLEAAASE